MPIDWSRFEEIVRSNERFLLTSHVRPDCDALGSELGMAGILEALGKQVRIVNDHPVPPNLAFIDPDGRIETLAQAQPLDEFDVLMVLDTSAWVQLGAMADVLRDSQATKVVVDHHVSEDDLGAETFKNPRAESTGRLVVEAAEHLGVQLTPQMAVPLFAAQATDTGWFRFMSVTGDAFRVGATLVDSGAVPQDIYAALYEQDSLARLNLRGTILARAKTELNGRLIYTAALLEDFEKTGALPSDTEDTINLTLGVAGVEVAVIFVAQANGGFKISLRSRSDVDCSRLAEQFGGGGHKAAAGAFIDEPLDVAQQQVLDAARAAMR